MKVYISFFRFNKMNIVICILFFLTGCATNFNEIKHVEKPADVAYLHTSMPNLKVNGFFLDQNVKVTIKTEKNIVSFDGPVLLKIPKEPIVEVGTEKVAGATFAACISALPLCPLTLLVMQTATGKTRQIETNCIGTLEFYARNNEHYRVKLEETSNIVPEIKIIMMPHDVEVSVALLTCEDISAIEIAN